MSANPNDPSYEPPRAGSGGPDVGHGKLFGADLYALYRAGRHFFPDVANTFSEVASAQYWLGTTLDGQAAAVGTPAAMTAMSTLSNTLQDAIRRSCLTLREAGIALVNTADTYAKTDEAASAEFRRLYDADHATYYSQPTEVVPTPPSYTDPAPTPTPVVTGRVRED